MDNYASASMHFHSCFYLTLLQGKGGLKIQQHNYVIHHKVPSLNFTKELQGLHDLYILQYFNENDIVFYDDSYLKGSCKLTTNQYHLYPYSTSRLSSEDLEEHVGDNELLEKIIRGKITEEELEEDDGFEDDDEFFEEEFDE